MKREVVGALLEHAGSKKPVEADAALEILVHLARVDDLSPFSSFLEGLLDFLDSFTADHIRKIFTLLGTSDLPSWTIDHHSALSCGKLPKSNVIDLSCAHLRAVYGSTCPSRR